ncbi:unnamed protein product, partial [Medioppia subpectinata]
MDDQQKPDVKHIGDIVGEWGKWQFRLFIFCFIQESVSALNNMGYSFMAYDNDFWCSDVPPDYQEKTAEMKCFKFNNLNETCNEWQYDRTQFANSINTQITNGHVDRAEHTLRNALKVNGKSDENLKKQLTELSAYLQQ